jgi:hypothetical protein
MNPSEVDEIEAVLRAPANSWFNNVQQLAFARLLAIARTGQQARRDLDLAHRERETMRAEIETLKRHPAGVR